MKSQVKVYNAIIVLANLMDKQGNLNEESRSRMDKATECYHENKSPILVTCGWAYRGDSTIPIAYAMRDYALAHDIPSNAIKTELTSRDTVGDAFFTKVNLAIPNKWVSLLVVTSTYHVERTKKIFSFIYGSRYSVDVIGATGEENDQLRKTEHQSTEAFYSTFQGVDSGDDETILEILRKRHPFYNGTVYFKI